MSLRAIPMSSRSAATFPTPMAFVPATAPRWTSLEQLGPVRSTGLFWVPRAPGGNRHQLRMYVAAYTPGPASVQVRVDQLVDADGEGRKQPIASYDATIPAGGGAQFILNVTSLAGEAIEVLIGSSVADPFALAASLDIVEVDQGGDVLNVLRVLAAGDFVFVAPPADTFAQASGFELLTSGFFDVPVPSAASAPDLRIDFQNFSDRLQTAFVRVYTLEPTTMTKTLVLAQEVPVRGNGGAELFVPPKFVAGSPTEVEVRVPTDQGARVLSPSINLLERVGDEALAVFFIGPTQFQLLMATNAG